MTDSYTMPTIKTAISVPADLFEQIEKTARRSGVSRSEFFVRAASQYLRALDDEQVTARLNEIYSQPQQADDRRARRAVSKSFFKRARNAW